MTKKISWSLQIHCKEFSLYLIDKIFLFLNIRANINELYNKNKNYNIINVVVFYYVM